MFGKTRQKQREIGTLLGAATRIIGDIEFKGGLHLDGRVQGNIVSTPGEDAVLSVSPQGVVEGNVAVPEVVLNGTVKGDVVANERVELGATARVVGNVIYNLIEMASGAEVNGKLIHKVPRKSAAAGGTSSEADSARQEGPVGSLEA